MRECGVLLHVSSLPGEGGCGTLGNNARRFVEFLLAAGQSRWQVLPLTPPAKGHSPYSSYSVFAGNPAFIDLRALADEDLLAPELISSLPEGTDAVDFNWCETAHLDLLRRSFEYSAVRLNRHLERFKLWNQFWLPDYAMFMALRTAFDGKPYQSWPERFRLRDEKAISRARLELSKEISFWEYAQFLFFSQWRALKRYANSRGIKIVGDMPIYVNADSSDAWSHPSVFAMDADLKLEKVAGVPPDAFTADGQLWGNPLYNWKYLRKSRYKWWAERLRYAGVLYDCVRVDHFRAIANYWAIPARAKSAKQGEWIDGPGMDFLRAMEKASPGLELIAEDLGLLDDKARRLLQDSGLPGMKILQFAFSTEEESDYLPHNFIQNCVGYTGTHDNDTVQGWMKTGPTDEVDYARKYFNIGDDREAHWAFIRGLYATRADLVIVQMQDALGLGGEARMNMPGIAEGNWAWRLLPEQVNVQTAKELRKMAEVYARCAVRKS